MDSAVQSADRLKNLTANLQAQLRQNMSVLEDKLRRAREFVAKVKKIYIEGSRQFSKCKNVNVVYSGHALSYLANSQARHSNMKTNIVN